MQGNTDKVNESDDSIIINSNDNKTCYKHTKTKPNLKGNGNMVDNTNEAQSYSIEVEEKNSLSTTTENKKQENERMHNFIHVTPIRKQDMHKLSQKKSNFSNNTHIKMHKYKLCAKSFRRIKNKCALDYLFEIINTEAEGLDLTPPPSAKKYIINGFEQENIKKTTEYADFKRKKQKQKQKVKTHNSNDFKIKRSRGRPPVITPELASSEYDEQGVKLDMIVGGIDFDDSLFKVIDIDDKRFFGCPDDSCKKKFPSLSRAKRHYIVHTGHRPFKCKNKSCSKFFSRRDNMLQHERSHCNASKKHQKLDN